MSSKGMIAMSIARASRSAKANRQARSGEVFSRRRKQLTHADVDAGRALAQSGEQRRQHHGGSAVRSADREPARGPGWIERRGGRDDARARGQNVGDRAGKLRRARRRHDALGRSEEQRIVEQPAQPAEPVADGGGREVQPIGRPADMPLFQHRLEEDQKVEVGSGEINFIQHIAEIISLDSVGPNCDLCRGNQNKEPSCQPRPSPTSSSDLPKPTRR